MAPLLAMAPSVSATSDAIVHAMTSSRPQRRYVVADLGTHVLRLLHRYVLPDVVADLIGTVVFMPGTLF